MFPPVPGVAAGVCGFGRLTAGAPWERAPPVNWLLSRTFRNPKERKERIPICHSIHKRLPSTFGNTEEGKFCI